MPRARQVRARLAEDLRVGVLGRHAQLAREAWCALVGRRRRAAARGARRRAWSTRCSRWPCWTRPRRRPRRPCRRTRRTACPFRRAGGRAARAGSRLASSRRTTRKLSSLCSRTRPTSVLPTRWMVMPRIVGLHCRRSQLFDGFSRWRAQPPAARPPTAGSTFTSAGDSCIVGVRLGRRLRRQSARPSRRLAGGSVAVIRIFRRRGLDGRSGLYAVRGRIRGRRRLHGRVGAPRPLAARLHYPLSPAIRASMNRSPRPTAPAWAFRPSDRARRARARARTA